MVLTWIFNNCFHIEKKLLSRDRHKADFLSLPNFFSREAAEGMTDGTVFFWNQHKASTLCLLYSKQLNGIMKSSFLIIQPLCFWSHITESRNIHQMHLATSTNSPSLRTFLSATNKMLFISVPVFTLGQIWHCIHSPLQLKKTIWFLIKQRENDSTML